MFFWYRLTQVVLDKGMLNRLLLMMLISCIWSADVTVWIYLGIYMALSASVWFGGVMVKALAYNSKGREFNSRLSRCQVTTLGKLFAHMCLCHQAV